MAQGIGEPGDKLNLKKQLEKNYALPVKRTGTQGR